MRTQTPFAHSQSLIPQDRLRSGMPWDSLTFHSSLTPPPSVWYTEAGGTVASLTWSPRDGYTYEDEHDAASWVTYSKGEIISVAVAPEWQRQGLATDLLQRARKLVSYPIVHSDVLSADGLAWSEKVGEVIAEVDDAKKAASAANQYTKWGRDKQGPPGMTLAQAKGAGYTDGPYYHATDHAAKILAQGFLTKGAPTYLMGPGDLEEYRAFNSVNQVWLGKSKEDVEGYGSDVVTVYAKPGGVVDGGGQTFAGGYYAHDPANVVPIIDAKTADWRPFTAEPYWLEHDVTISGDGASGRRSYEIHVGGKPYGNRSSLAEAQALVEAQYGPLTWKTIRMPKMEVPHYYWGDTTMFTSPTTIWAADFD